MSDPEVVERGRTASDLVASIPASSRAVVLESFGEPSQLQLREVDTPRLTRPDELLVRVHATSVNPIEWKMRAGMGLPKAAWRRAIGPRMILGIDYAGTVVATGEGVAGFRVGDEVMGAMPLAGTYADYLIVRPSDARSAIAKTPSHVSFEAAAVVPFAGLVAYAGLVTQGYLPNPATGARVLIVGASGGVGHLAIQMAKRGLHAACVVGVSSAKNASFVESLGADEVIPHDCVPVEAIPERYPEWERSFDLIFDAVGIDAYYRTVAPRLLKRTGRFVTAALPQTAPGRAGEDVDLLGGIALLGRLAARQIRGRYSLIAGLIGGLPSKSGFAQIVAWVAEGKLVPHLAATYDLERIAEAHAAIETGRTVGKIAVRITTPQAASEG